MGMSSSRLHVQVNLALCCKAMLPVLCIGTVSVWLDHSSGVRPLAQLSSCLRKQPDGVSSLSLISLGKIRSTHHLVDLRCAHGLQASLYGAGFAWTSPLLGAASNKAQISEAADDGDVC